MKCVRRAIFRNIEYVFILQNKKKIVFSKKTVKICFGATFDHFVGQGGVSHPPPPTITISFLYPKLDAEYSRKGKIFMQFCNF